MRGCVGWVHVAEQRAASQYRQRTIPLHRCRFIRPPALADAITVKPIAVKPGTQNNSGQNGSATLMPEGKQARPIIDLANAPAGVAQAAHSIMEAATSWTRRRSGRSRPLRSGASSPCCRCRWIPSSEKKRRSTCTRAPPRSRFTSPAGMSSSPCSSGAASSGRLDLCLFVAAQRFFGV